MGQYSNKIGGSVPSEILPSAVAVVQDVWEWDLDSVEGIKVQGGQLTLTFSGSQAGTATQWTEGNEEECNFIGYWYEFIENLSRGVGIQIVDASGAVYDIMPQAGYVDYTAGILLSGKTGINNVDSEIKITLPDTFVDIYKDGFIESDWSNFDDLIGRPAIDIANPVGLRAVTRTTQTSSFLNAGVMTSPTLVRRRFRAMIGIRSASSYNAATNNKYTYGLRLTPGVNYRLVYSWGIDINGTPQIEVYNNKTTQTEAHLIDAIAFPAATPWGNNQGNTTPAYSLYFETSFQRQIDFIAKDTGAGLDGISFKLGGFSTPRITHSATIDFQSYSDLSQVILVPLTLSSYIILEGL